MRKLVSIMLSVLLLTALIVPASAEGTDSFKITPSATTVEVGKTVTLTVSVVDVQECQTFGVLVDIGDGFKLSSNESSDESSIKSTGAGMRCPITLNPGDVYLDKVAQMYGVGGWNINYTPGTDKDDIEKEPVITAVKPQAGDFGTIVLEATKAGTYEIKGVYALMTAAGEVVEGTVDSVTITVTEAASGDVLLGDADGNGRVLPKDAALILQYYLGTIDDSAVVVKALDVDGNGRVLPKDAALALQIYLGN